MQDYYIKIARQLASRRKWLTAKTLPCPKCKSEQVQLCDWLSCPSRWRCRTCRSRYVYEPGPKDVPLIEPSVSAAGSLHHLVNTSYEPVDCVCCGEPKQTGRYAGLPVCLPCYKTGLLKEWLAQQGASDWPDVSLENTNR